MFDARALLDSILGGQTAQQATTAAVTTLLKVMVDPSTPASTKVRAADSVMSHAAKANEIEDIEARVSELERAAEALLKAAR